MNPFGPVQLYVPPATVFPSNKISSPSHKFGVVVDAVAVGVGLIVTTKLFSSKQFGTVPVSAYT